MSVPVDIRVETRDFDPGAELAAARRRLGGAAGAVATFIGLVRDRAAPGQPVATLHLEHYPGMTENSIRAIVDRALSRWPLLDVVVVHRVGDLAPSEQIVFVQVASAHRAAAFAACEFLMDFLKTDAVFWKREDSPDGRRWIESTGDDCRRAEAWGDGDA